MEIDDLEKCEYDDGCDFCDSPQDGSYAKIINDQCGMETLYVVCGKCAGLPKQKTTSMSAFEIWKEGKKQGWTKHRLKQELIKAGKITPL